jgi:hypothetical protein
MVHQGLQDALRFASQADEHLEMFTRKYEESRIYNHCLMQRKFGLNCLSLSSHLVLTRWFRTPEKAYYTESDQNHLRKSSHLTRKLRQSIDLGRDIYQKVN